jgi:hypothetical protein
MGMPVGRVNNSEDLATCPSHACRKKVCCHHHVQGPAVRGSTKTKINGFFIMTVTTQGVHQQATCCGPNQWVAQSTATDHQVMVEGRPIFCVGDITLHDQKDQGKLTSGSPNVFVGR